MKVSKFQFVQVEKDRIVVRFYNEEKDRFEKVCACKAYSVYEDTLLRADSNYYFAYEGKLYPLGEGKVVLSERFSEGILRMFDTSQLKPPFKALFLLSGYGEYFARAQDYELGKKSYDDFVDLLYDLVNTSINSRQLDILIKIDFFSEFGEINKLLYIYEKFQLLYKIKQVKKDEQLLRFGLTEDDVRPFADDETKTIVEEIDCEAYIKHIGGDVSDLDDCIKYKYVTNPDRSKEKIPNGYSSKKVFKKYNVSEKDRRMFATKEVTGRFTAIHNRKLLKYLWEKNDVQKCSLSQRMKYQLEHLGYIEYVNYILSPRYIVITDIDTTYSPKFYAYCLKTGQMSPMKIHNRLNNKDEKIKMSFERLPVENGDVVYMNKCDKEAKRKKVDGEWMTVPGEWVWWLNDYRKVTDEREVFGDA